MRKVPSILLGEQGKEKEGCLFRAKISMEIRRALPSDLEDINKLLYQVHKVHSTGRPDIFRPDNKKYTDEELMEIIADEKRPIFVGILNGHVAGYAFCVFVEHRGERSLSDIRTLYIDDLCVDEALREKHIGKTLYEYVVNYAREEGFYNLTLNVWACNPSAIKFYESCGLSVQKIGMEKLL